MTIFKRGNFVAGLDIGTTKTCAVIARDEGNGSMKLEGFGEVPSRGIKKSMVINLENTVNTILAAVREAELCAGVPIESVYVGLSGNQIKGFNSRGVVAIEGKQKEISQRDVERVLAKTREVSIPLDREILHVLPQEFIVDDQSGIHNPIGMAGLRLEVEAHITTSTKTGSQNIKKCVNGAGLEVEGLVLEQIASGLDVLTDEEREQGVALVDIGGGTSGLSIYVDGCIWHTAVIPVGGDQITNDLAIGLRTPNSEAEMIKKRAGIIRNILPEENNETVEVPDLSGTKMRLIPVRLLSQIIRPRVEEILLLIDHEIKRMGYDELLNMGIVITGGTALLPGIAEVAEDIFKMPVRLGIPKTRAEFPRDLENPSFSCVRGLIQYGIMNRLQQKLYEHSLLKSIKQKFNKWVLKFRNDKLSLPATNFFMYPVTKKS
ncbi:MAG: cell division protein FtsA [Candidatus Schekmanbacteria bacterium RBG_13_48_7]|uniref:Cell division protein FtsA n=1 Tax=Candidatus Schekmanbacteria bacterium RBG_13_48_7 TaxID=1817878 RepID=A0A1F7RWB7_9BACT|nr:MAG: cell division protein FtsA [Candidatus Schekmanbacteria bacterium RBG_13_48_7]